MTRSGKVIETPTAEHKDEPAEKETPNHKEEQAKKEKEVADAYFKRRMEEDRRKKIPYPPLTDKQKAYKQQFEKFLDIFKRLNINIPFAEALAQMPSYARFLKEILSKKRKLTENEPVALTEECSAIIQRKMPTKVKDPGSFSIPCTIGTTTIEKVLCDLGASINVMPLSLMKKLGIEEVKPTRVTLQLADRSTRQAYGVVEDVLVKVENFLIPVDFVILDIEEDAGIPMIFGRPFLATSGALIDVPKGELILRIEGEEAIIKVFTKEDPPSGDKSGNQVCCLAEKKVEEEKNIRVHPQQDESKPKVKMEKQKSKGKHEKTKFKALWVPFSHPPEYDYHHGQAQILSKGMVSSMSSSYQPP